MYGDSADAPRRVLGQDLVASGGVAPDVECGQRRIRRRLTTPEAGRPRHRALEQAAEVLSDERLGCDPARRRKGESSSCRGHRTILGRLLGGRRTVLAIRTWGWALPHPPQRRRRRIGPFAVDGSTTRPRCRTSISPAATSRRAAFRVRSINGRHVSSSVPPTALAASDGQMVAPRARAASRSMMATSRERSTSVSFWRRHASEQYRTSFQFRSHFLRHSIVRPHTAQGFGSGRFVPSATTQS